MPAKLVDMAVSNNILIVALDTFRLLRIDLDNPLEVEGKKKENWCFFYKFILNCFAFNDRN